MAYTSYSTRHTAAIAKSAVTATELISLESCPCLQVEVLSFQPFQLAAEAIVPAKAVRVLQLTKYFEEPMVLTAKSFTPRFVIANHLSPLIAVGMDRSVMVNLTFASYSGQVPTTKRMREAYKPTSLVPCGGKAIVLAIKLFAWFSTASVLAHLSVKAFTHRRSPSQPSSVLLGFH